MASQRKITNFLLDLFFPVKCIDCRTESSDFLCKPCFKKIKIINYFSCPFCEEKNNEGKICRNCKNYHFLDGLSTASEYDNKTVKKTIKACKFNLIKELEKPLSLLLIQKLSKPQIYSKIIQRTDLIIPVPLHKKRLNWRGFNQSELIGLRLSQHFGIPINTNILARIKNNPPQSKIADKKERQKNIQNIFTVKMENAVLNTQNITETQNFAPLQDKRILLIDDVCTTGSTLDECAKQLKNSGASAVWAAVVARGR